MNGTLLLMTARSPTAGRNTAALTLSKKRYTITVFMIIRVSIQPGFKYGSSDALA
ncbi:hypothetical protein HI13_contig00012-0019 [Edwardsiella piscicida]|nr:hypothetical protein HI13_contig00012-0019 [Edwardsiella piscicida]